MKAVENNVSYKDGDEIQPLSVDLSGQNTVVSAGVITVEMPRACLSYTSGKTYSDDTDESNRRGYEYL